jgi:uncharacterized protein YndB with AHSA1/START domain
MIALTIHHRIDVDATVETLWKVLTDNEFIPQYMFGCLAETDWKIGSPLLWKGKADGNLYVKGRIVSFEPSHRLVYTVIDPNSGLADVPSNYLTMTCELKSRGTHRSILEITQGDFSTVENGANRHKDSIESGDSIMVAIAKIAAELGRPRPVG